MTLTAAIVGYGRRAEEHAAALKDVDGMRLGGIADPEEARRDLAATDGVPAFADVDDMLADVRPEIVLVVTPADVRLDPVERAARADSVRAIMVEKPLAHSVAEGREMVAACDREGVLIAVGHQLRFVPSFLALKEVIDSGELGTIEFIRGSCYGHLLDQGPHLIDTIRWVTGGRRVQWAMSQGGQGVVSASPSESREGLARGIPAWSTHHLALEGGLRATLETGVLHQRGDQFGQGDEMDDYLDKRLTVVGSRGIAQAVAGGDCRVLTDGDADWRVHRGGVQAYVGANRAFHEELRDAVLDGTPHRADAHDGLESLEALIACARSLAEGDAVSLPLDAESAAGAGTSVGRRAEPEVSVIIPLSDHRGYAEPAVKSWTQDQTFDRNRYEVILGLDGAEAGLEESVRPLLGSNDRAIRREGAPEIELYDEGARAARGRIVLFTEPHCIADPSFIEELIAYLTRTGEVGAFGRSVGINANALARMEEVLYEEGMEIWGEPGHWCRVILRAIAIDRQTYLDVGGFETRYGRFAEFALAATLHAKGKRLGYASGAAVRHAYTTSFPMLEPAVIDFINGEMAYRLDYPAQYCERYFGVPQEWTERRMVKRESGRAAWALSCRALLRRSSWREGSARSHLATMRRVAPVALFGSAPARARATISYSLAKARCRLWRFNERRLLRAYRTAWDRLNHRSRMRYVAGLAPEKSAADLASPFDLADLSDDRLFGFHRQEQSNGTRFRWSRSVAFADVPVDPGSYRVEIDTGGLRDPRGVSVQVFFNGTRVPSERLDVDPRLIRFAVEPEHFSEDPDQRLGLACMPFTPSRVADSPDSRELGLPVSSVSFEPCGNGGS
ncbi:MAG TPA: Gfo/Idh/MocA family oxidoreductase [Solirubrobacterales bacterium]|nr:Gfo/Idh/MocA family oxidoreductase [Solirubrobacterales bacterium]